MKILVAPASFKGSLSATQAARAIAADIRRALPHAEIVLLALADGGEGTVDAVLSATDGRRVSAIVTGPLGGPTTAEYGLISDGRTAVLEMASAAGLNLTPDTQHDPLRATTFGVGELIMAAVQAGATRLIIGLGGSATCDGGAGAMQALGVLFYDAAGQLLRGNLGGGDLVNIARIDRSKLRFPVGVSVVIASDVINPLYGPNGAAVVYGPQKGADAAAVAVLEFGLHHYAEILRRDTGQDVAQTPGAGAAGGLGAALMAFLGAAMQPGIDLILDLTDFESKAQNADWVFTGEGKIDAQTLQGKTILGVLRRCQPLGIPVIAFGGTVEARASDALKTQGLAAALPIITGSMTVEDAMRDAPRLLEEAAAHAAANLYTREIKHEKEYGQQ